jgi:hypothetical protein
VSAEAFAKADPTGLALKIGQAFRRR